MGKVVVLLNCFSNDGTEERGQPVEVEVEEGSENLTWGMTDLQANNTPPRAYYPQHFTKALTNSSKVTYCERRAATINAIVWQVNVFSVSNTQFYTILQAQACHLKTPLLEHFWRNIYANHMSTWARVTNHSNREVCCTRSEVKACLSTSESQVARSKIAPGAIQTETHQMVHQIVDARYTAKEALYVGAFATSLAKLFF
jgi:hypothetical protein